MWIWSNRDGATNTRAAGQCGRRMAMKERSTFAKTFDKPLVRKPEWEAAIKGAKQHDKILRRAYGNPNAYPRQEETEQ